MTQSSFHSVVRSVVTGAVALTLLLAPRLASAQSSPPPSHPLPSMDGRAWAQFSLQGPVARDLYFNFEAQDRMYLGDVAPGSSQQVIFRTGLAYRFLNTPQTGSMTFGVAYGWEPSWRRPGFVDFTDEHRGDAEWRWDFTEPGSGVRVTTRVRFEARFRHPDPGVEVGFRLRQQARVMVPVESSRTFYVVAWDELFENLGDAGRTAMGNGFTPQWENAGFDQNRAFAGVAVQAIPSILRFETGYLNQFQRRPGNAAGDLMNHVFVLQTSVSWL